MPKIDKQKSYAEIDIKTYYYEDMKIDEIILGICLLTNVFEFMLLLLLLFLNKKKKIKKIKIIYVQVLLS